MRRPLGLVIALCCSAFSSLCESSAAANARLTHVHRTKSSLEFTASTHLGVFRVLITTTGQRPRQRIDNIRIWSGGSEISVPMTEDMRVSNPALRDVFMDTTASYTCLDDECPDIRTWPAGLYIRYGNERHWGKGERPISNSCDQAFMVVEVLADHIEEINLFECTDAGISAPVKTLYQAQAQ